MPYLVQWKSSPAGRLWMERLKQKSEKNGETSQRRYEADAVGGSESSTPDAQSIVPSGWNLKLKNNTWMEFVLWAVTGYLGCLAFIHYAPAPFLVKSYFGFIISIKPVLITRWKYIRQGNEVMILIKRASFALSCSQGCCYTILGYVVSEPTESLPFLDVSHLLQLALFFTRHQGIQLTDEHCPQFGPTLQC